MEDLGDLVAFVVSDLGPVLPVGPHGDDHATNVVSALTLEREEVSVGFLSLLATLVRVAPAALGGAPQILSDVTAAVISRFERGTIGERTRALDVVAGLLQPNGPLRAVDGFVPALVDAFLPLAFDLPLCAAFDWEDARSVMLVLGKLARAIQAAIRAAPEVGEPMVAAMLGEAGCDDQQVAVWLEAARTGRTPDDRFQTFEAHFKSFMRELGGS